MATNIKFLGGRNILDGCSLICLLVCSLRRSEIPPLFYRTSSPSGPLPKRVMDGPMDNRLDQWTDGHTLVTLSWLKTRREKIIQFKTEWYPTPASLPIPPFPHLLDPLSPEPPTASLSSSTSATLCFCHCHYHRCDCHYCGHCCCLWHHQLERPILYNFYLLPSRDAVDDQFQPTLFMLNDLTMG